MGGVEFVLLLVLLGMAYGLINKALDRRDGGAAREETELMQDIHRQLARMEERVEALETILFERRRREQHRPADMT